MPGSKQKPIEDTRTQRQKFIDAAREHETAEDEDAFRRAVRKVATSTIERPKKGGKPSTE